MTDLQTKQLLENIAKHFKIYGELVDAQRFKTGNINATYRASFDNNGEKSDYVIQKINSYAFKFPEKIMQNIGNVTEHLMEKGDNVLNFLKSNIGDRFFIDEDGSYWRVYEYVPGRTFDSGENEDILRNAASAFGKFQYNLKDFDVPTLFETCPGFHDTEGRTNKLFEDLKRDPCGRADEVKDIVEYLLRYSGMATTLGNMIREKRLPLRVTHNDTKINNVLFSEQGYEPLVVLDLDTVQPGLLAYDFGDAIRSAACTTDEDETDLLKVKLDIEKYRIFSEGFIKELKDGFDENELHLLPLGAFTMTFELVVRFLDDYVVGDRYFRIKYPKHNLDRAKCQLALLKDINRKYDDMYDILNKIIK